VIRLLAADVDLLDAALAGDEELASALGCPVAPGWIGFTEALQPTRDALAADPDGATWGTRLFLGTAPDELVGWGGFKGPPADGVVEIGYEIAPGRQGRGLAGAAARALVAEAFADLAVDTVRAHTLPESNRSNRLLESAGFVNRGEALEGTDQVWRFDLRREGWSKPDSPTA
jgi:RimJ/RimL family protein N-acetyltransferase